MKAVLDKHKEARLSVHFRADASGVLAPDAADATAEVAEEYDVQVPVSGGAGAGNDTAAEVRGCQPACRAAWAAAADGGGTSAGRPRRVEGSTSWDVGVWGVNAVARCCCCRSDALWPS